MNTRRLALRRSVGPWSAGTLLCRRGEQDDPEVWHVSAWLDPGREVFDVPREWTVERRGRGGAARPAPPQPAPRPARPIYASRRAQAAALASGVVGVELAVERAVAAGDTRPAKGGALLAHLGDGVVAVVRPATSRHTRRPVLLISDLWKPKAA